MDVLGSTSVLSDLLVFWRLFWKDNMCPTLTLMQYEPKISIHSCFLSVICIAISNIIVQVALESVSATHQLNSAIHTLALCVRPLLLTGFAANPESAESGPVDAGAHKVQTVYQQCLHKYSCIPVPHHI